MLRLRELLPLYSVIFLGFLGYALTITLFIPMLMDKNFAFLPADISTSWRATLSGLLLAMYPLGQFFGSPVIGNLSDHFGRKKVLLLSLFACTLGFAGMALSIQFHRITLLFISAFFTGLCESNMAISQSVIADRSQDVAEKTKLIGYAYSASSLGYVIGPLLGGIGGSILSYGAPFLITAIAVLLITSWISISFTDQYTSNSKTPINILTSVTAIKSIFHQPRLYKIYLINFIIFFAVQGLYRVVPLYVVDHWHPSLAIYSLLLSFVSLLCFIANLAFLGRFAKIFTTQKLLSYLLLLGGLLVILIPIPQNFVWLWIIFGAAVIPTIMALPTCTTWLSQQVSSREQGQVLGNNQALLVLGESSSAALGGIIAAILIYLPITINGLLLLSAGIIILRFMR